MDGDDGDLEVFDGCRVYLSGFENAEALTQVRRLIVSGGGMVQRTLDHGVTHVVLRSAQSPLPKDAQGLIVVEFRWLEACVAARRRVPELPFVVKQEAAQEHAMPPRGQVQRQPTNERPTQELQGEQPKPAAQQQQQQQQQQPLARALSGSFGATPVMRRTSSLAATQDLTAMYAAEAKGAKVQKPQQQPSSQQNPNNIKNNNNNNNNNNNHPQPTHANQPPPQQQQPARPQAKPPVYLPGQLLPWCRPEPAVASGRPALAGKVVAFSPDFAVVSFLEKYAGLVAKLGGRVVDATCPSDYYVVHGLRHRPEDLPVPGGKSPGPLKPASGNTVTSPERTSPAVARMVWAAQAPRARLVTPMWLDACARNGCAVKLSASVLFTPLPAASLGPLPGSESLVIAFTNFGNECDLAVEAIEQLVGRCGARSSRGFDPSTATHLVANYAFGPKYEMALQAKLPAVSFLWLVDSLRARRWLGTQPYEFTDQDRERGAAINAAFAHMDEIPDSPAPWQPEAVPGESGSGELLPLPTSSASSERAADPDDRETGSRRGSSGVGGGATLKGFDTREAREFLLGPAHKGAQANKSEDKKQRGRKRTLWELSGMSDCEEQERMEADVGAGQAAGRGGESDSAEENPRGVATVVARRPRLSLGSELAASMGANLEQAGALIGQHAQQRPREPAHEDVAPAHEDVAPAHGGATNQVPVADAPIDATLQAAFVPIATIVAKRATPASRNAQRGGGPQGAASQPLMRMPILPRVPNKGPVTSCLRGVVAYVCVSHDAARQTYIQTLAAMGAIHQMAFDLRSLTHYIVGPTKAKSKELTAAESLPAIRIVSPFWVAECAGTGTRATELLFPANFDPDNNITGIMSVRRAGTQGAARASPALAGAKAGSKRVQQTPRSRSKPVQGLPRSGKRTSFSDTDDEDPRPAGPTGGRNNNSQLQHRPDSRLGDRYGDGFAPYEQGDVAMDLGTVLDAAAWRPPEEEPPSMPGRASVSVFAGAQAPRKPSAPIVVAGSTDSGEEDYGSLRTTLVAGHRTQAGSGGGRAGGGLAVVPGGNKVSVFVSDQHPPNSGRAGRGAAAAPLELSPVKPADQAQGPPPPETNSAAEAMKDQPPVLEVDDEAREMFAALQKTAATHQALQHGGTAAPARRLRSGVVRTPWLDRADTDVGSDHPSGSSQLSDDEAHANLPIKFGKKQPTAVAASATSAAAAPMASTNASGASLVKASPMKPLSKSALMAAKAAATAADAGVIFSGPSAGNRGRATQREAKDRSGRSQAAAAAAPAAKASRSSMISALFQNLGADDRAGVTQSIAGEPIRLLISNVSDPERKRALCAKARSLGATVIEAREYDPSCTHTVVEKFHLNSKVLGTIAAGKFLVHTSFVETSAERGEWEREEDHEWVVEDATTPKDRDQLAAPRRWRLSKHKPFENWTVFSLRSPQLTTFTPILQAGGATVTVGNAWADALAAEPAHSHVMSFHDQPAPPQDLAAKLAARGSAIRTMQAIQQVLLDSKTN